MKLIVGLGNPGIRYTATRHNIGFTVVEALARDLGIVLRRDILGKCRCGKGTLEARALLCALPLAFMNRSGAVVARLVRKHRIQPEDLLIVCDDIDLAFGRIKIKPEGSSGGHRGLQSIMEAVAFPAVPRLRCGVDRPGASEDAADYVLEPFCAAEQQQVPALVERAVACCRLWVAQGMAECMNRCNRIDPAGEIKK